MKLCRKATSLVSSTPRELFISSNQKLIPEHRTHQHVTIFFGEEARQGKTGRWLWSSKVLTVFRGRWIKHNVGNTCFLINSLRVGTKKGPACLQTHQQRNKDKTRLSTGACPFWVCVTSRKRLKTGSSFGEVHGHTLCGARAPLRRVSTAHTNVRSEARERNSCTLGHSFPSFG